MDEIMINKWNTQVHSNDTVYYLGDFSLSGNITESILPRLHGNKHLVMGNHDLCHPVNKKKAELGRMLYLKAGFHSLSLESEIQISGQSVLLHHLPYLNPTTTDQYAGKYDKFRPTNKGQWLLCGHIHEKWRQLNRMINVGVDVWDFSPVPITIIEQMISPPGKESCPQPA
jgi:calcineurin-like phosphoesterase family protein